MSMIPVRTKLLCNSSSRPSTAMLDKVAAAGAMAGLGVCSSGEEPECYNSSGAYIGGNLTSSGGSSGGGTSAWAGINDLLKLGLTIAGQAYLNNNQARIATYGPNGTVLYQTSQIPSQYFQPAVVGGVGGRIDRTGVGTGGGFEMSTTAVVMIGVAALAVIMVMGRRH